MDFSRVQLPESRNKFHNGYFDNQLVDVFYAKLVQQRIIRGIENCFFIDVGANIGTFSLIPLVDEKTSCLALEVNPSVLKVLDETITLNNAKDRVFTMNIGAWDKKTTLPLTVHNDDRYSGIATLGTNEKGVENYFMSATHDTNYRKIDVPCDTIDSILSEKFEGKTVLGIKLDIEGAEYFALKGARETLLRDKPFILCENHKQHTDKFYHTENDVVAFLESCGYRKTWGTVSDILMEASE